MSAPLELDFRRPAGATGRRIGVWMLLAAGVLVAMLADHHAEVAERRTEADERHERLSDRLRAGQPRRATGTPDPRTTAELQRANAVIDQLAVPWEELFGAIEAANARGTAVLSLTPNARERIVRITGEARSMDELLSYVGRLGSQPLLSQVHLQGYNTVQREGVPVIAFTLAAAWKPST